MVYFAFFFTFELYFLAFNLVDFLKLLLLLMLFKLLLVNVHIFPERIINEKRAAGRSGGALGAQPESRGCYSPL